MNHHIVITGASGGLGKEIARAFAQEANLIGLHYAKNRRKVENLSEEIIKNKAAAYLIQSDFSKENFTENFVEQLPEQNNKINVLILNAGVVEENLIIKTSEEEWDKILNINYKAQVEILEKLSEKSLAENSHVIIIGSHAGIKGRAGLAAYSAAKGALIGFAKDAAKRLAKKNIFVNVILPGWLKTEMTKHINSSVFQKNISENILDRATETKEVAEFIFSLSKMKNVSGQTFALDSRPLFL